MKDSEKIKPLSVPEQIAIIIGPILIIFGLILVLSKPTDINTELGDIVSSLKGIGILLVALATINWGILSNRISRLEDLLEQLVELQN